MCYSINKLNLPVVGIAEEEENDMAVIFLKKNGEVFLI